MRNESAPTACPTGEADICNIIHTVYNCVDCFFKMKKLTNIYSEFFNCLTKSRSMWYYNCAITFKAEYI